MNIEKNTRRLNMISTLFALILFCLFATISLMVVFIGVDVYGSIVNRTETSFELDTTIMYVATTIRQSNNIRLDEINGTVALVIEQEISQQPFETWIFHYNNYLREIFTRSENILLIEPASGHPLISVYNFTVELIEDNLLLLQSQTENGLKSSMFVRTMSP